MTTKMKAPGAASPWWVRHPERLDQELRELRALEGGACIVEPSDPSNGDGLLRLTLTYRLDGVPLTLRAILPREYPWFAPHVELVEPETLFRRHRRRTDGALCLLADTAHDWHPDMTLAHLLVAQLPRIAAANASNGPTDMEHGRAEGANTYMSSTLPGALLIDPKHQRRQGQATDGVAQLDFKSYHRHLQVTLNVVATHSGKTVSRSIPMPGPAPNTMLVPWIRLDREIEPSDTAASLVTWAVRKLPTVHRAAPWILVCFKDEIGYRSRGWNWLLLHASRGNEALLLGEPMGPDVLSARAPEVRGLGGKHIAVIGVGSVGAQIALGLGRAGAGRLTLVDGDVARAATAARQSNTHNTGRRKVDAIGDSVQAFNPYGTVDKHYVRLGSWADDGSALAAIAVADVVVDAAASTAVSRVLSIAARTNSTPLVTACATWGAWGGSVADLTPATGACWFCLELARADRTVPWPPAADMPPISDGCSDPTFPGSWHDLAEISLQATRIAIVRATSPGRDGCETTDSVFTCSLRTPGHAPTAPHWLKVPLEIHPECLHHSAKQRALASQQLRMI